MIKSLIALDLDVRDKQVFAKIKNFEILDKKTAMISVNKIGLEAKQYYDFILSI